MTTPEIIAEINAISIIDSEDFEPLERLDILADELAQNPDAHTACASFSCWNGIRTWSLAHPANQFTRWKNIRGITNRYYFNR